MSLALDAGLVDSILSFDSPLLLPFFREEMPAGDRKQAFEVLQLQRAYIWLRRADDPLVRNFAAICDTSFARSFQEPGSSVHQSDFLFRMTGGTHAPDFFWPGENTQRSGTMIHPGSAGRSKRWPFSNFLTLREQLPGRVTWILGPAEEDLQEHIPAQDEAIAGAELRQVRDALLAARVFIGNDSGIAHLAALCRTPSVVLFGPTDPRIWAPRGPVSVLHSPGPEVSVPWQDVLDLVNAAALSKEE